MDEWDNNFDDEGEPPRPRAEGVRILGAEEAAAAVSAQRAGEPAPPPEPLKFEQRPAAPVETPLFPRDDNDPTISVPTPAAPGNLPHWTEPPTGEVPAVLSGRFGESDVDLDLTESDVDGGDDLSAWSALSGGAPRWRDQHDAWDDAGFEDASVLAGDEPPMGALDESRPGSASMFDFDDEDDADSFGDLGVDDEIAPIRLKPSGAGGGGAQPPRPRPLRPTRAAPSARRPANAGTATSPRDMQAALILAGGLGAIALLLFKLGPAWSMLIAIAVVVMSSAELYDVLRRAGYQPATLVGLVGTLGIMVAAYQKGETALPLAIVLVTAATFAWYLIRVVHARPTVNVAATLLAFLWTGVFGSYAALILGAGKGHNHVGVALLLGVVIAVVANDTGAYFVGSRMGSRPLAPEISPNKTIEGIVGGAVVSIVVTVLILGFVPHVHPWDGGKALWLAVVVSLAAPLGDLAESMIKRDLGIKDMGSLLPGHGGVLDRFDAMLFCLPAAYYLIRVIG